MSETKPPTPGEIATARQWINRVGASQGYTEECALVLLSALDAAEARATAAEKERDEALRGFGLLPDDPREVRRYAEVFAREIRECPPKAQDRPEVCPCVSVITAHVRRMIVERLDALRERDEARASSESWRTRFRGVAGGLRAFLATQPQTDKVRETIAALERDLMWKEAPRG